MVNQRRPKQNGAPARQRPAPRYDRLLAIAERNYAPGRMSTGMLYALRGDRRYTYQGQDRRDLRADLRAAWTQKYSGEALTDDVIRSVIDELRRRAREAVPDEPTVVEQATEMAQLATGPEDAASAYYAEDGSTWWARPTRDGDVPVMLATFTAEIAEEVTLDDGTEQTLTWLVRVTARDGRSGETRITPDQLGRPQQWAARAAGTSALVMPGLAIADHLRVAVQSTSRPERRTVYTHTGWRQIGGRRAYLTASGAMAAEGLDRSVTVDLGTLSGYELPCETTETTLRAAIQAELDLLEGLAPDTVMIPLLAGAWRAPLPLPPDCGVWEHGRTGAYKTALTALAQQHYGPSMDAQHLPGHWTATGNALVAQANLLANALFVVDDFSPDATTADARRRADAADRLLRGTANQGGRPRLRPDGTLRPDRVPRAQVLTSAEDVPPPVESLIARAMIVEVIRGSVNVGTLSTAQARAAEGAYAVATGGYIRYLAVRWDRQPGLPAHLITVRDELRAQGRADGQHPRSISNVASLELGCLEWLGYARHASAIDEDRQEELWQRCRKALAEVGAEQEKYMRDGDPVRMYLRSLHALIASGRAHLAQASMAGGVPGEPARWGWSDERAGVEPSPLQPEVTPLWRPRGDRLGWVAGEDVYLQPDAAYQAARQWADSAGARIGVSERTLHRDLRDRSLLESTDGPHLTVRRDLSGQRSRRVLHLSAQVFGGAA
jgi:hypothetical protein